MCYSDCAIETVFSEEGDKYLLVSVVCYFLSPSRIQKIVLECVTLPSDWISSSWQSNIRLEANIVFLP